MKNLIAIAHKREAQAFLEHFHYEKTACKELMVSENHYLLITGEGLTKSLHKTSLALGFLLSQNMKPHSLINYGVAGVLDEKIALGKLYSVRTCYAFHTLKQMHFQSYTSLPKKGLDCISSYERVLDFESSQELSYFGSLVDRELWALAFTSDKLNIPFESFKWGFDRGGKVCKEALSKDPLFSYAFLKHFLSQKFSLKKKEEDHLGLPSKYYATFSQKEKIKSLLKKLKKKDKNFSLETVLIPQEIKHPKQRTQKLIETLKRKLSPEMSHLKKVLDEMNSEIKSFGVKVQFKSDFETKDIELKMKISNLKDYEQLKSALSQWPYEEIQNTLEGDF